MEWIIGLFVLWFISRGGDKEKSVRRPEKRSDFNSFQNELNELRKNLKKSNAEEVCDKGKSHINIPEKEFPKASFTDSSVSIEGLVKPDYDSIYVSKTQQIIDVVRSRKISKLVHFTRYENLTGIMDKGLLQRSILNIGATKSYYNDALRLDGHEDSISVSITFPNYKMFYKHRLLSDAIGWVVLEIDPSILWERDCAFCRYNAADSRIITKGVESMKGVDALENMFKEVSYSQESRKDHKLIDADPTDPQAEVLVFGSIPVEKIIAVNFQDRMLKVEFQKNYPEMRAVYNVDYFSSRGYVR